MKFIVYPQPTVTTPHTHRHRHILMNPSIQSSKWQSPLWHDMSLLWHRLSSLRSVVGGSVRVRHIDTLCSTKDPQYSGCGELSIRVWGTWTLWTAPHTHSAQEWSTQTLWALVAQRWPLWSDETLKDASAPYWIAFSSWGGIDVYVLYLYTCTDICDHVSSLALPGRVCVCNYVYVYVCNCVYSCVCVITVNFLRSNHSPYLSQRSSA